MAEGEDGQGWSYKTFGGGASDGKVSSWEIFAECGVMGTSSLVPKALRMIRLTGPSGRGLKG